MPVPDSIKKVLIIENQMWHILLHHLRMDKGLISCCMQNQIATLLVAFFQYPLLQLRYIEMKYYKITFLLILCLEPAA